jgi:hypothetical protein
VAHAILEVLSGMHVHRHGASPRKMSPTAQLAVVESNGGRAVLVEATQRHTPSSKSQRISPLSVVHVLDQAHRFLRHHPLLPPARMLARIQSSVPSMDIKHSSSAQRATLRHRAVESSTPTRLRRRKVRRMSRAQAAQ